MTDHVLPIPDETGGSPGDTAPDDQVPDPVESPLPAFLRNPGLEIRDGVYEVPGLRVNG